MAQLFPITNISREMINYPVSGGFFPTPRNKSTKKGNKEMAVEGTFKLVIKDGTSDYKYNAKTGTYTSKVVDSVHEFDTLAEGLSEFLWTVNDEYNDHKVSLTFVPSKKKGKK